MSRQTDKPKDLPQPQPERRSPPSSPPSPLIIDPSKKSDPPFHVEPDTPWERPKKESS